jgi:hypothetical protein
MRCERMTGKDERRRGTTGRRAQLDRVDLNALGVGPEFLYHSGSARRSATQFLDCFLLARIAIAARTPAPRGTRSGGHAADITIYCRSALM